MIGLEQAARARIERCHGQIRNSIDSVNQGVPLRAEPETSRALARLQIKGGMTRDAAMAAHTGLVTQPADRPSPGMERVWGSTIDFVGVAFLERGWHAAQAVGRVASRDGAPIGTGFLIAPGLFLTNNHVIPDTAEARLCVLEFDYERDPTGNLREVTRFDTDPGAFFITDDRDDLDYTLIGVGRRLSGRKMLADFGYCPLSDADDKHALGEVANVVQHPDGRYKEVVLRENTLVSRLETVLHYVADTEPGSSGSPVFNNEWKAIALHHWGGPWRQQRDAQGRWVPREVNEGIRISAIVNELRDRMDELSAAHRRVLGDALRLGQVTEAAPSGGTPREDNGAPSMIIRDDGTVAWRVPIEISVGIPPIVSAGNGEAPGRTPRELEPDTTPAASEAFRRKVDRNYENRKGFRRRFIRSTPIDMPALSSRLQQRAARNLQAEPGDDPFELPYQNFSVIVDGVRRLPLVTACNIDGKTSNNIQRSTGRISRAERRMLDDPEPEAREKWYEDPRIDPSQCTNDTLYLDQVVAPGRNRTDRIFQRGHMVRRLDPVWGNNDKTSLRAEADTFHFTNCTPQIGFFNTRASLWQGIENYVLDNARSEDERVCVFTGPVLNDDIDREWRTDLFPGFKVPLQFWKIVVWKADDGLAAVAMVADQGPVIKALPERIEEAEAFLDTSKVEDFLTTVEEIEAVTDLDFGAAVRQADLHTFGPESIRGAKTRTRIRKLEDIPLVRKPGQGAGYPAAKRKTGSKTKK